MGESIGVDGVPQAIASGAKLVLRAEQLQADLAAKVAEIKAKEHRQDLFPTPGDEFSTPFAPTYTKNSHSLQEFLAKPSANPEADPDIGGAMVNIGNYITDTFSAVWATDQQNSRNIGSV
ncbi:hypothetical protein ABH935_009254 [Catenulispora sp. GAS73]|uniref:hypothetical protein n=1 Tax=Catenulispora sp. GAS73 TaxID=3156269 RepID=UPI003517578D